MKGEKNENIEIKLFDVNPDILPNIEDIRSNHLNNHPSNNLNNHPSNNKSFKVVNPKRNKKITPKIVSPKIIRDFRDNRDKKTIRNNIYKKLPEIPQHIIDLPILNYEEIKKEIEIV